jgi:hypothetical protein
MPPQPSCCKLHLPRTEVHPTCTASCGWRGRHALTRWSSSSSRRPCEPQEAMRFIDRFISLHTHPARGSRPRAAPLCAGIPVAQPHAHLSPYTVSVMPVSLPLANSSCMPTVCSCKKNAFLCVTCSYHKKRWPAALSWARSQHPGGSCTAKWWVTS